MKGELLIPKAKNAEISLALSPFFSVNSTGEKEFQGGIFLQPFVRIAYAVMHEAMTVCLYLQSGKFQQNGIEDSNSYKKDR
jgi:hypothetical protein